MLLRDTGVSGRGDRRGDLRSAHRALTPLGMSGGTYHATTQCYHFTWEFISDSAILIYYTAHMAVPIKWSLHEPRWWRGHRCYFSLYCQLEPLIPPIASPWSGVWIVPYQPLTTIKPLFVKSLPCVASCRYEQSAIQASEPWLRNTTPWWRIIKTLRVSEILSWTCSTTGKYSFKYVL